MRTQWNQFAATCIVVAACIGGGDHPLLVDPGAPFPNEPAGATVLMDYDTDFGNPSDPPWGYVGDPGDLSTVTDATAPVNPSKVGRARFNPGCCDGGGPARLETYQGPGRGAPPSGWETWYVSDWVKFSADFVPNPADQKIFQIFFTGGGGDNFIRFCAPGLGGATTFTARMSAAPAGGSIQNYGGAQIIQRNQWYQIEFKWTRATGRIQMWVRPQGGQPQLVTNATISGYQQPNSGSEVLFWWWGYGGSGAYPGATAGYIYHNHIRSSYLP